MHLTLSILHGLYTTRKHHFGHFALIIGQEDNHYVVVDPYVANCPQKMSILDAEAGYTSYYEQNIVKSEVSLDDEWKNILRESVMGNLNNTEGMGNCYEMIRDLCAEINDSDKIIEEIKKQSQNNSYYLQQRFKYLSYGRINYSWMLKYLGNKYNVESLVNLSQDIEKVGYEMRIILGLMTKISCIEEENKLKQLKSSIVEILSQSIDREEIIMMKILDIVK